MTPNFNPNVYTYTLEGTTRNNSVTFTFNPSVDNGLTVTPRLSVGYLNFPTGADSKTAVENFVVSNGQNSATYTVNITVNK